MKHHSEFSGGTRLFATLGVVALASLPFGAAASDWPTGQITIVVPFNPGASNDIFGRGVARAMQDNLGVNVVVENRQGGGGFIGSSYVARAAPDGYTLLFMANDVVNLGRPSTVDFDWTRDITPIGLAVQTATGLVVHDSVPVTSVQELIALANSGEREVFYGHTGVGTIQHLHSELFNALAGTELTGVSYPSAAPAVTDLVGARLDVLFSTIAAAQGHLESGDIRLLAYSGPYTPASAPPAPTVAEAGVEGYDASIWWGVYAPAGLPDDLRDAINAAVNAAVDSASFRELVDNAGAVPRTMSATEFRDFMQSETELIDRVIEAAGIVYE